MYKKNRIYYIAIALLVCFIAFALSSGIAGDISKKISKKLMPGIKYRLYHHIGNLEVSAKHYFLLPSGWYVKELFTEPLSTEVLMSMFFNSVFNILFQPVFLCPFTPQVILNVVLAPFFIYGAVRYFGKVWPLLILFLVLSFQIGTYDSVVEALVRHGMSCELIYLMIGLAGFTGWTAKSL